MSFAGRFKAFVNHPTGPKTTHFWGPVANWGFVAAVRPSSAFSIFLHPRNYLLLACHASNEAAQLYQLKRALVHKWTSPASA
ncbi:hypothetical protein DYB28_009432 [Aphanomyces astaci]|uniref:Mitochondrial pyruvate carrier n=1 Tax=Aphanomyces astaci TaxID=112090 RepID=A0A9X8DUQ9_APHAT|nr:hypothetical protein DYB28_009432 [Aphanomyces astaci]